MIAWDEVFAERHLVLFHLRQKTLHFPHCFISSFQTMDHATLNNYEQGTRLTGFHCSKPWIQLQNAVRHGKTGNHMTH